MKGQLQSDVVRDVAVTAVALEEATMEQAPVVKTKTTEKKKISAN